MSLSGAHVQLGRGLLGAAVAGRRRPLFVGWSLTDTCNLSCDYCGRWDRGSPELSHDRMRAIATEIADAGAARVSLTGGEPLVHPLCVELAQTFARRGVEVSLNTNGLLLERHLGELEGSLRTITFSVDGGRAAHDAVRGEGSWDGAVEAARQAAARGIRIALHAVITTANLDQIDDLLELAGSLGCKAGFTVVEEVPSMGRRDLDPLVPTPAQWHAVVDDLLARLDRGERRIQNSSAGLRYLRNWPIYAPIKCSAGLVYARIEPDGSMYGCGNLVRGGNGVSLQEHDFGDAFAAMERETCRSCWCDTRVEMNLILSGVPSSVRAAMAR
ncbi:MAG: radical SAM protein [Proteobacteria bacterium]|nr:radical SAM protein [Pseudomonadota bacterium]